MHNHHVSSMVHIKHRSSAKQNNEEVTSSGKTTAAQNQSTFICAESSEIFLMIKYQKMGLISCLFFSIN